MTQQLDKLNACLVVDLTNFVCYCIDLDSTKDAADTKQLPICVIGVMLDFNIYEDFNKIILRVAQVLKKHVLIHQSFLLHPRSQSFQSTAKPH